MANRKTISTKLASTVMKYYVDGCKQKDFCAWIADDLIKPMQKYK